jgi:hypothetical protein
LSQTEFLIDKKIMYTIQWHGTLFISTTSWLNLLPAKVYVGINLLRSPLTKDTNPHEILFSSPTGSYGQVFSFGWNFKSFLRIHIYIDNVTWKDCSLHYPAQILFVNWKSKMDAITWQILTWDSMENDSHDLKQWKWYVHDGLGSH